MGKPAVQLEPGSITNRGQNQNQWPRIDHPICDPSQHCESRDGLMEPARHPQALIGIPPPLRTFVERRRALLQRALPLARARRQLEERRASSILHGRVREAMSF